MNARENNTKFMMKGKFQPSHKTVEATCGIFEESLSIYE